MPATDASVLIPTRNAGKGLQKVLEQVFAQKGVSFDVVVWDSGSTDCTREIAEKFPVKLKTISPKEFGHGKTRNAMAREAKGKYLVFLTQDAVPETIEWLKKLVQGLKEKNVAGTYGRQVARKNSSPMEKFFYGKKYGNKKIFRNSKNRGEEDIVFSNANSAVKRKLFLEEPFSEKTIVSEDYEWAFRVMRKGFDIVYEPEAAVLHSHSHGLASDFRRHFDIGYSYSQIHENFDSARFTKSGIGFYRELVGWLQKENLSHLIPYALVSGTVKFSGLTAGKNGKFLPKNVCRVLSGQKWFWGK